MNKVAIFASGSGSNAENLVNFFREQELITTSIIICNKPDAYVLKRAENLNIKSLVLSKSELQSDKILTILKELDIDYIILAGYLLKIPEILVENYRDKIINIHPALLPKYGGKGMYGHFVHEAVVAAGECESGITIHLVDEKYDNGKILFQAKCNVDKTDTPENVASKIAKLEMTHFPEVVQKYILG